MATFFILGQLFGGQLFELFARETNLKKQSSVFWIYCNDIKQNWQARTLALRKALSFLQVRHRKFRNGRFRPCS